MKHITITYNKKYDSYKDKLGGATDDGTYTDIFIHHGKGQIDYLTFLSVLFHEEGHCVLGKRGIVARCERTDEIWAWWIAEIRLERHYQKDWKKYYKKFIRYRGECLRTHEKK